MQPIARLKCLYTNARSMGNKQEELEAMVQLENCYLIAITEAIWWDKSHNWNTGMEGYKLYRRDRQGRKGGGVALYVKKWIDCEELPLRNSHEQVESLWVKIKHQTNKGHLVVGVCYRPPDQGEPFDEAFLLQLQEAPCSRALILMGDLNHPDVCWESYTAGSKQSRRLLECVEDNFLVQVLDKRTRREAFLDLVLTSVDDLIKEVKIGGSLGCSDHGLVEFVISRDVGLAKSKVRTLDLRRANLQLLKELVEEILWDTVLRERGSDQIWQLFKDIFLSVQELSIPVCNKSSREGRKPVWLSNDLLVKLRQKKELHRQWKRGRVLWEEYRNAVWTCRDGIRKAKALTELNLARDAKNNKKGFYKYIGQKRKTKESVPPLKNVDGGLVTTDMEKAEVRNNFFASVFTGHQASHIS
ncbi:uncharacterized protein [Anas acuta]|uniref:uncharacterized protein n=1 Tax=Anas acuta TaxID=28680 RepID=UPI0035C8817F